MQVNDAIHSDWLEHPQVSAEKKQYQRLSSSV